MWLTTPDGSQLLSRQPDVEFGITAARGPVPAPDAASVTVTVDDRQRFQRMVGFGASFTESAAVLVHDHLAAPERDEVMVRLFDRREGIGLSVLRQPMGASDFALDNYTYDDAPAADPALASFSVSRDDAAIVPLLVQARRLNPALQVMATPWSPPAWMKSGRSLIGGTLEPSAYDPYARYFVRFVQEYAARGIPVWAVTVQNEPHFSPAGYPGMLMEPAEEAAFVGRHLGPALAAAGAGTRILAFDGNWDGAARALAVLDDPHAGPYLAGTAFHCYAGDPSRQEEVHRRHPDKAILLTECSGGGWSPDFATNLRWGVHTLLVEAIRHWASAVVLWNVALDQNDGPTNGGCQDCRGVVTVDTRTGRASYNVEYYVLGHASRFVAPGAVRIASTTHGDAGIETVAFRNPDGRLALIALNLSAEQRDVGVRSSGRWFGFGLPAGAVATCSWA